MAEQKKVSSTNKKTKTNSTKKNTTATKKTNTAVSKKTSTSVKNTQPKAASAPKTATKKSSSTLNATKKTTSSTKSTKKEPEKKITTTKKTQNQPKKTISKQKDIIELKNTNGSKKTPATKTKSTSIKKKTNATNNNKVKNASTKTKTDLDKKQKSSSKKKIEPIKKITSKEKIRGKEVSKNTQTELRNNIKSFIIKVKQNCITFGKKVSLQTKKVNSLVVNKIKVRTKKSISSLKKVGSASLLKTKKVFKNTVKNIKSTKLKFADFLKARKENKKNRKKEPVVKKKQILKNEIKQEEFSLNEVKEKRKRKPLRNLIILILLLGTFYVLLLIPYGISTYQSEDSGKILDVPKFVKVKEECCNFSATFSTPRSIWSLQKDLDKIISKYEVLNCDGKQYYYNAKENYTIVDYGIIDGTFLNQIYFTYGLGNSCDIDTKFKKLELLADDFSLKDAKRDGNYVIDGDTIYNKKAYDDFMEKVKKKTPSTLRIVTTNKEGDVLITDVEYLSSGKYMVSYDGTRDRNSKNHRSIIAYKFEHLKVKKNKLYAYNGDELDTKSKKKYETYYLLTLPKE